MPFLTTALAVGAIASGVAGAGASIYGAHKQADAAKSAAQLQYQESQNALDFQKQEFATQQANEAPFLKAGQQAAGELSSLTSTPGAGLLTPWNTPFVAPTGLTEQNDPGFQARLNLGETSLQNSAAARGGVLGGGTAKDINSFAQDYASNEYSNVYGRAVQQYQQAYNIFNNNQANEFNRLSAIAGGGQTAAGQLGAEGSAAAGNVANINLTAGRDIGQQYGNAAAATASGYVGASNALGGTVSNLGGLALLQQLLQQQQQKNPVTDAGGEYV